MMTKIIFLEMQGRRTKAHKADHDSYLFHEPLALEYMSAIAKNLGFSTKILQQVDQSNYGILEIIKEYMPNIVALSCWSANYIPSIDILRRIKKVNSKILSIVGGIHATIDKDIILNKDVDIVVLGEGEATFEDILKRYKNDESLKGCKGIYHKINGDIVYESRRDRILDLDQILLPDRSCTDFSRYTVHAINYPPPSEQRAALMMGSRGCKYDCEFCTNKTAWGLKVTYRSPENIIEEIKELKEKHKINHIQWADENFTHNREWIFSVANAIIKNNLQIPATIFSRIGDIDEDLLDLLKKAGIVAISYGVESLDNKVLKRMRKGVNLKRIINTFKMTTDKGILASALLMLGYPDEDKDSLDILHTELQKIDLTRFTISYTYPFLSTALRERVDRNDLWLNNKFKEPSYATIEQQVLRTKHGLCLKDFISNLYKTIYKSEKYRKMQEKIIRIDPRFKRSFEEFNTILHSDVGIF